MIREGMERGLKEIHSTADQKDHVWEYVNYGRISDLDLKSNVSDMTSSLVLEDKVVQNYIEVT